MGQHKPVTATRHKPVVSSPIVRNKEMHSPISLASNFLPFTLPAKCGFLQRLSGGGGVFTVAFIGYLPLNDLTGSNIFNMTHTRLECTVGQQQTSSSTHVRLIQLRQQCSDSLSPLWVQSGITRQDRPGLTS